MNKKFLLLLLAIMLTVGTAVAQGGPPDFDNTDPEAPAAPIPGLILVAGVALALGIRYNRNND
ncbi:hypothetical protein SAMN05192588_0660 [Nonlabens sp. Hel1_33_55]|uniref:hypothetical protein n=1 Tax=Nonlabens sp. Hel1_33_55 TaxID=1336802 RepID=UPI000875D16D|nr:hypothetical protein [Nonlabens sp. Hel1_33_55]SCX99985.1 hypothetical protein SAMN05192588_0660 [Nonlabens sp. Hel1_33_55]